MPEAPESILSSCWNWFAENAAREGILGASRRVFAISWEFLRDSMPHRRRQRYGDVDYDWDHRVDTTSATVDWRDRLLGLLHSPYQPTEPALFHEMLRSLSIDFANFIFIDIGSGKGRTLLMASDYPFRRILGIELLADLHRIAQENIAKYRSESQQCFSMESSCCDAREFVLPLEPTLFYLFNPLPESGLRQLLRHIEESLQTHPRPVVLLYHNPLLETVLASSPVFKKVAGTHQYVVYTT